MKENALTKPDETRQVLFYEEITLNITRPKYNVAARNYDSPQGNYTAYLKIHLVILSVYHANFFSS